MASYDKSKDSAYTRQVQQVLSSLGADLGAGGIDGKWGAYTQAAYEANKAAVDAALYGSGGSQSAYQSAYQSLWDSMPQLSYTYVSTPSYSYEYYYSIGDALEAANYEKQKQQAQTNLENAQAALQESVKTTKANVEKSTTARGFGRSSYATDALQATDLAAMSQGQALLADFDQTLMMLDAQRHANAAAYASNAFQAQENRQLQASIANAQMANELALNQWKAQLDLMNSYNQNLWSASSYSGGSSGSSGRSSSSSSSKKSNSSNMSSLFSSVQKSTSTSKGGVRVSSQNIRSR